MTRGGASPSSAPGGPAPPSAPGGPKLGFLDGIKNGKAATPGGSGARRPGTSRAGAGGAGGGAAGGGGGAAGPKMRQFHWDVMADTAGTIWESEHMAEEDAEMDVTALFPDLEDALAVAAPKPVSKAAGTAEKVKPKQVTMVEPKRSQNICIMLAQFGRKPFSDIVQAVHELDVEAIGLSGVTALLDFVPEESERAMIDE